jgi:ADP-dependent NAD(P)H-hydrate dehydratase / NAD(P)H-hydrate epimerase
MLKILSTAQIKSLDEYTIRHEPISSIDLMERACTAFATWFTERFKKDYTIAVVCGTGNNGGDGLGIARILKEKGYLIEVWIVRGGMKESADFKINFDRIHEKIPVHEIHVNSGHTLFTESSIIIDAIFGSGLSRPAESVYQKVIQSINETKSVRIAIDLPSGLMADTASSGEIVQAHHTVSFQLPKLALMFPQNARYVGEWQSVNIGLNKEFVEMAQSKHYLLTHDDIRERIQPRPKFGHKGNFGHALLLVGRYGKMGAAILSARAALRSGVGLLTLHVPKCGYAIMQTSVPEAMVSVDAQSKVISEFPVVETFSAIGIGPGVGKDKKTVAAFTQLLESYLKPFVIDADALNILSENSALIHLLPQGSILTPHPKEFERLVGDWKNDFERLEKQREFSIKTKTVVLLKGAHSSITAPDGKVYFNNTGNAGMATGGSGDVLTGMITALLAQGYSSLDSALIGCWIHGLAGDQAAAYLGQISMMASDIVDYLPGAFRI